MSRKIRLWCRNSHIFWLFDSCLFTFCIILCHFWETYKLFILEYMINDFAHSVSSEKIHNFHCSYFSKTSKENIISSKCSITCQCKLVWTCKSISSMTVWCVWNILLLYVRKYNILPSRWYRVKSSISSFYDPILIWDQNISADVW